MNAQETHLDSDQALGLVELLGDDAGATLAHAVGCSRCRERLAEVAAIRAALRPDPAVRPGFADEVMAAVPGEEVEAASRWGWGIATGGLVWAGAACFLVGADAGSGPAAAAAVSLVAGLAALAVTVAGRPPPRLGRLSAGPPR